MARFIPWYLGCILLFQQAGTAAAEQSAKELPPLEVELTTACPAILADSRVFYVPVSPLPAKRESYKGEWVEIKLNRYSLCGPYSFSISSAVPRIEFFSKKDATQEPVARLNIATAVSSQDKGISRRRKVLAFFVAQPKKKAYAVFSIKHTEPVWRSFTLINKSASSIGVKLGEQNVSIPSGMQKVVKFQSAREKVAIYRQTKSGAQLIRSSVWNLKEGEREFVLFYGEPMRWAHISDSKLRTESK